MNLPSPIEQLHSDLFSQHNVEVYVKRDDLIDPVISGNKWRKLKFNIEKFKAGRYDKLLTFGGAYSNHISATARAGKELGVKTIGIVRGDELKADANDTLRQASADGMELIFTKREEYALRDEKYYHEELRRRHGNIWIVPEGGSNYYGVLGCQEILKEVDIPFTHVITACGTGTTATGLLLSSSSEVIGVSALKGGDFLTENIKNHLMTLSLPESHISDVMGRFVLQTGYHFGGYAKYNKELLEFIETFEDQYKIPLDQVYTGKMMYALLDLIEQNYFPENSKIIALHTGGLQGKKGLKK
ncbi:MAG: 1-aminocyclopropane-1-carboxylate deaminase/D-cysteine desulfhydrase [Crocinitomicaceae bacterium]|nr:1-aminocyclopropane-1-carboxylate deaminase/D-cysteine desulfhydrase [Crocinitomicaceae bacterium]